MMQTEHGTVRPTETFTPAPRPSYAWTPRDIQEIQANYIEELSSTWMYNALAEIDSRKERAALLRELAKYEERHTAHWERLLRHLGHPIPRDAKMPGQRILVRVAKFVGVGAVVPLLHKQEAAAIDMYKDQAERWKDPMAQEIIREILPDEVAHEMELFHSMRETGGTSGTLRSAILGANDGLGSILALVAGVAGATSRSLTVFVAGLAGLVAGAASMAASNYISIKSEQDVYASQVHLQREALNVAPDLKRAELKAAYRAKGLSEKEADALTARLAEKPDELLKAILAEQSGITQANIQKASRLAMYTGIAFALAGLMPLLPFLFLPATLAMIAAVIVTCTALFFAGLFRSLSTLKPFLRSGVEMVLIGLASATATYLIGLLVGGVTGV